MKPLVLSIVLIVACLAGAAEQDVQLASEFVAVDELLEALRSGPAEFDLSPLTAAEGLDPWLVGERLRVRSGIDVARRYAQLVARSAPGLDRYLAGAPPTVYRGEMDAVERRLSSLAAAGDWREAGAVAERAAGDLPERCVWRAHLLLLGAAAQEGAAPVDQVVRAWLRAGQAAWLVGWQAAAEQAFESAWGCAYPAGYWLGVAEATRGILAVQEARGDRHGQAHSKCELAQVLEAVGDLEGSVRFYGEAIEAYTELGSLDDALEARCMRSGTLAAAGRLREALAEQRALAQQLASPEHARVAAFNRTIKATVHWYLGDIQMAMRDLAVADGGEDIERALLLGTRALLESQSGALSSAAQLYDTAQGLFFRAGDPAQARVARANRAYVLVLSAALGMGRRRDQASTAESPLGKPPAALLEEARKELYRTIPAMVSAGAEGARLAAQATLGKAFYLSGWPQMARRILTRTARDASAIQGWRTAADAWTELSILHGKAEEWSEARQCAGMGIDALTKGQGGLSSADQVGPAALRADLHEQGAQAAAELGDLSGMLAFLEGGRGMALLRGLGGRDAARSAGVSPKTAEQLRLKRELRLGRHRAFQKAVGSQASADLWDAFKAAQLEEAEAQRLADSEGEALLQQVAPAEPKPIAHIQRRLRELGVAQQAGRVVLCVSFSLHQKRLRALVLGPETARIVAYSESAAEAVEEALESLVPRVAAEGGRGVEVDAPGRAVGITDVVAVLARELVPALALPPGQQISLLVVPSGSMAFVPFGQLFGDDVMVALQPSLSTWHFLSQRSMSRGEGVLAVGNPDYRASADADVLVTRGGPRLGALPYTAEEIDAIASDASIDRKLLRLEATEGRLRHELGDRAARGKRLRSLHIACHGLVDVEWPALSCLALTSGDDEDGFLTAAEALRLPVNADLVVLSACQTGRGQLARGEGVLGLTGAFLHAGAQRVLVSLWDVDDAATAFLMKAFYAKWRNGAMGAAEALRHAQMATRDHPSGKWKDPKYWAAWVLWGLAD